MQTTMADTTTKSEWTIRRILLALNSCSNEKSTIEAAVLLAKRLEAELAGLFVEDVNLHNLAELPFAREILGTHLQQRLFDAAQLRRSMRAEAERVRQALMRGAEQHHVSWSFSRTQGPLVAETVIAAESVDLLIIGRDCQGVIVGNAPTEIVGRIVQQSHCSVLITAHHQRSPYREVYAVIDNSSGSMRTLQFALVLARLEQLPLRLFIITRDVGDLTELMEDVSSRTRDFQSGIIVETIPSAAVIMSELSPAEAALIVLGHTLLNVDGDLFKQLFQMFDGPILIVR